MILDKEYKEVKLSETKKDFYQIFSELLETAKNITERWDPTSTNESDPGIVLLKLLAAIGDKLNYNVDKNILEAFMPSATQEESMRKLCDMMGYSMKYYRSATTSVKISLTNSSEIKFTDYDINISLPKFKNIVDANSEINYVTIDTAAFANNSLVQTVRAIEGTIHDCKSGNSENLITINDLDENNRFYLPETQVAENGIFISNVVNSEAVDWEEWGDSVDNLNTKVNGTKCWKFGFDSKIQRPYIQFPDDISALIEDGLYIKYIRTNGVNGNIAANTLEKFVSVPEEFVVTKKNSTDTVNLTDDNIFILNASAAMTGANKESIDEAYINYKKTVGTFDTLVTCRDYANKIYQLISSDHENRNLVSNVIVSDIRDDLNNSYTLCTFNEFGIKYKDLAVQVEDSTTHAKKPAINNFDLVIYPFKQIANLNTKDEFDNSFRYTNEKWSEILTGISNYKTISHNPVEPKSEDIACIKNYLKLDAKIVTTKKVNSFEEYLILNNIYISIYNKFNARHVDFGEEIPYDDIVKCIEEADPRIKTAIVEEPKIETRICLVSGEEYAESDTYNSKFNKYINKLALRNILAGKVPVFEYNRDFTSAFDEVKSSYESVYPINGKKIKSLRPSLTIKNLNNLSSTNSLELNKNEVIQFRAPNLNTLVTYPAYVNYLFISNSSSIPKDVPANTEYSIKDNEYLYLNYTDENDIVHNEVFTAETIIKPNFTLSTNPSKLASKTLANNTNFIVKEVKDGEIINSSAGAITLEAGTKLYSLGVQEQIEIRCISRVELKNKILNCFWILNDIVDEANKKTSTIPFENNKYTLKDNEYFFFTDNNKDELAFYGSGTEIVRSDDTITFSRSIKDSDVDADKIFTYGLSALSDNDWQLKILTGDQTLTFNEYQYETLSEKDKLNSCVLNSASATVLDSSEWKKCTSASFTRNNETVYSLPEFDLGEDVYWSAKTKLNLNCGPNTSQTLYGFEDSYNTTTCYSFDKLVINYDDESSTTIKNESKDYNLNLNFNYLTQTSSELVNTTINKYSFDGKLVEELHDFKVHVYINNSATFGDSGASGSRSPIPVGNVQGKWTKVILSGGNEKTLNLNVLVPENHKAILMIYYTSSLKTSDVSKLAKISYIGTGTSIKILNAENNSELCDANGWWNFDTSSNTTKHLYPNHINNILLTGSGTITINSEQDTDSVLIISQLAVVEVVNDELKMNSSLDYKQVSNESSALTPMEQLLKDISDYDENLDFYYTCPIENNSAININELAGEKLSDPKMLYDYNNVNNKFTISEIDSDYMTKYGIALTRSSRL